MIRRARRDDVARMLEIYAPYVRDTSVSFEYEVPSLEDFTARFERITARYPWIVWEESGRVMGYAYADAAFSRAAYQWDADLSIYLDAAIRGRGIGHRMYDWLEARMDELGYANLYAVVSGDNVESCRFHEKRRYSLLGVLTNAGFKHGSWHDIRWYGLSLSGDRVPEGPPLRDS